MMALLTGIAGLVVNGTSTIKGIGKWSVTPKLDLNEFASSATMGAKSRVKGNDDWSGEYVAYGDTPIVLPGDSFAFKGVIDPTGGAGSTAIGATGTAIVDEFSIKIDVEGGKEIQHSVKFSGNGALAYNDIITAPSADVAQTVVSAAGLPMYYTLTPAVALSEVYTALADVRSMELTLKRENKEYASSSTLLHKQRVKGNLDCTFSISAYVNGGLQAFSALMPLGVPIGLRFYTAAASYWEIRWGILGGYGSIEVDRNSTNIVGVTMNGGLLTTATISAAAANGTIKTPGGVTVWP